MAAERQYLTQALSGLLDSNALEPVVEYLLSFPSDQPQHLLEYLTELLGHQPVSFSCAYWCGWSGDGIVLMADWLVCAARQGLPQLVEGLQEVRRKGNSTTATATATNEPSRPVGEVHMKKQPVAAPAPQKSHKQQNQIQFQGGRIVQQPKKQAKLSVHKPSNAAARPGSNAKAAPGSTQARPCACMGTIHDVIGNCLHCGKIACEQEQGGRCSFCGEAITLPISYDEALQQGLDEATLTAIAHKDKLLRFDRENAKRTHVHDAQADYYTNDSWLTPEERQKAREAMEKRAQRHNRSGKTVRVRYFARFTLLFSWSFWECETLCSGLLVVQIAIDLAGRKIVEVESEEEDESGVPEEKSRADAALPDHGEKLRSMENRLRGRAKQVYDDIRSKLASQATTSSLPRLDVAEIRVSKRIQHEDDTHEVGAVGADSFAADDSRPYPPDCKVAALSSMEATGSAIDYGGAQEQTVSTKQAANERAPSGQGKGGRGGGRGGRGGGGRGGGGKGRGGGKGGRGGQGKQQQAQPAAITP